DRAPLLENRKIGPTQASFFAIGPTTNLPPRGTDVLWGRGVRTSRRGRQLIERGSFRETPHAPHEDGCVAVEHGETPRASVRHWSNPGRRADYPLLRSRQPRTDEEQSAGAQPATISVPRPFLAARVYWLTKSSLFAQHDALREADDRVSAADSPEPELRVSSD